MTLSGTQSWGKTLTLFHNPRVLKELSPMQCYARTGHLLNTGPAASRSQRCARYTRIARGCLPAKSLLNLPRLGVKSHTGEQMNYNASKIKIK